MDVSLDPSTENDSLRLLRTNWKLVLLLVLGAIFYSRALTFGFVYDDAPQILANARLQHLRDVPGYFTQHLWAHMLPPSEGNYYRPLFLVWLFANFSLFGAKAWAWHLTTVLVQLCTTFAVFRLAVRLTGNERVALLTSALFLVHPLAIQPTVWISDVDDSLCLLLMIGSFLLYLKARARRGYLFFSLSLLLFVAALLMKETAVVVVPLVAAYELIFGSEGSKIARVRLAVRDALPFGLMFLGYFLVRSLVLGSALHAPVKASWLSCLATLPSVLWLYTENIFIPTRLALFYDLSYVTAASWSLVWLPLLAVTIVGAAVALLCSVGRSKPLFFGLLWVAITMALPLATMPLLGNLGLVHDRYFYPAMPGMFLISALLLNLLIGDRKTLGWALVALVIGSLAVLNWQQQGYWKSDETLFDRAFVVSPGAPKVRLQLAWRKMRAGNLQQANELIESVLKKDGRDFDAYFARFVLREQIKDLSGAEADARKALEVRPNSPQAHAMIANALMLQGREAEGQTELRKAVDGFPTNIDYRLDLADSYRRQKNFSAAREQYREATLLRPDDPVLRQYVAGFEREAAGRAGNPVP